MASSEGTNKSNTVQAVLLIHRPVTPLQLYIQFIQTPSLVLAPSLGASPVPVNLTYKTLKDLNCMYGRNRGSKVVLFKMIGTKSPSEFLNQDLGSRCKGYNVLTGQYSEEDLIVPHKAEVMNGSREYDCSFSAVIQNSIRVQCFVSILNANWDDL
ncbi:hypothetical protein F2P81_010907 [Scophthalmus maximus]|uniref:Uncharacterized protein n=1 Tax=Scophthalmus maximus TaxID=52904 RepID=A0A6A4SVV3_SCOMX|nr:hypothetical protein F2P81_010907 [Scophthalmus maximus]